MHVHVDALDTIYHNHIIGFSLQHNQKQRVPGGGGGEAIFAPLSAQALDTAVILSVA